MMENSKAHTNTAREEDIVQRSQQAHTEDGVERTFRRPLLNARAVCVGKSGILSVADARPLR